MYRLFSLCLLLAAALPVRAGIVVNSLADVVADDGQCTLPEAIIASNSVLPSGGMPGECVPGIGANTITFDVGGTITLTADLPSVGRAVDIIGPGSGFLTIDGQDLYSLFRFNGVEQTYRLQGLNLIRGTALANLGVIQVRNGNTLYMDFMRVADADLDGGDGSAVSCQDATLNMNWSRIENNGDGMDSDHGIELRGCDAEINYSLIASNLARGLTIENSDTAVRNVDIRHSTFTGNTSTIEPGGGGVLVDLGNNADVFVSIRHSTLTGNSAPGGGGLRILAGIGGNGLLRMKNTVIAQNVDSDTDTFPDIFQGFTTGYIITEGFNFIGDLAGSAGQFPVGNPNANGDYVGNSVARLDPMLGPLIINGGPTQVHLPSLAPASPLIDAGHCTGELHDQQGRGDRTERRRRLDLAAVGNSPTSDGCDIGAAEADGAYLPLEFSAQALLAGPYAGSGSMNTTLLSVLPVGQPYNTAPWNYAGTETNGAPNTAVDWVLLSLRRGAPLTPPTTAASAASVLLEEGELANEDGESLPFLLRQATVSPDMYYLEVDHRNHLAGMSRLPYPLTPMAGANIDLRPAGSWYGTNAAQDLGDGNEGLWGGDGDRSGGTTAFDFLNVWLPENGDPAGYTYGDFNLSSDVTAFDFLIVWLPANGQASQVP